MRGLLARAGRPLLAATTLSACNAVVGNEEKELVTAAETDADARVVPDATGDRRGDDATVDALLAEGAAPDGSNGQADGGGDASADGDAHSEAEAAPPMPCDLSKPFARATALVDNGVINTMSEQQTHATLTSAKIYFASFTTGNAQILASSVQPTGYSSPTPPANVNDTAHDNGGPSLTGDGLALYFHSNRGATYDLFTTTRNMLQDNFAAPTAITTVNDAAASDRNPFPGARKGGLYFDSDRSGGTRHVWYAPASPGGGFSAAIQIDLGSGDAMSPVLTSDELDIYFASTRTGGAALGKQDVWTAHRDDPSANFGLLQPVANANSAADDAPSWVSPDGCTLYLSTNALGSFHIYSATKPQ